MKIEMLVTCQACAGSGKELGGARFIQCSFCEGDRLLEDVQCDVCNGAGCARCRNEGRLYNVPCPDCNGEGQVRVPTKCAFCGGYGERPPDIFFQQ